MKIIFLLTLVGFLGLPPAYAGYYCYNRACAYIDYPSQCGRFSCTDNAPFADFSNPCPGYYRCYPPENLNW